MGGSGAGGRPGSVNLIALLLGSDIRVDSRGVLVTPVEGGIAQVGGELVDSSVGGGHFFGVRVSEGIGNCVDFVFYIESPLLRKKWAASDAESVSRAVRAGTIPFQRGSKGQPEPPTTGQWDGAYLQQRLLDPAVKQSRTSWRERSRMVGRQKLATR